ncbi:MAG TPA: YggT family protein [Longimicrobiaceae bacterium]|nr:YggT family protein [Longimicrobiaceae bacterium]
MGWLVLYNVLEVLKWLIIARALMSWFVDPRSANPLVAWIRNVTDAILRPISAVVPSAGGMDLSPLVAIFLIYFAQQAIATAPVGY